MLEALFYDAPLSLIRVSPETSSGNGDAPIPREIFGSSELGLSPETCSKTGSDERLAFGRLLGALLEPPPKTAQEGQSFQQRMLVNLRIASSLETSSQHGDVRGTVLRRFFQTEGFA